MVCQDEHQKIPKVWLLVNLHALDYEIICWFQVISRLQLLFDVWPVKVNWLDACLPSHSVRMTSFHLFVAIAGIYPVVWGQQRICGI